MTHRPFSLSCIRHFLFLMAAITLTLLLAMGCPITPTTYTVTYDGNGNTGGSVPVDGNVYKNGDTVAVLSVEDSFKKAGYLFDCWNTKANGTGTDRNEGSTFSMGSANVTLYAKWTPTATTASMMSVPGGSFQMGSLPDIGFGDERPIHTVNLTGFQMGKYEVTQSQYLSVTGSSPSYFSGTSLPVEQITWYDAVEFCNKLSVVEGYPPVYTITGRSPASGYPITSATVTMDMTKNGYRLPTEAEWEYAARGGNGSPGDYTYSGSNDLGTVAWYISNSVDTTHTVGTKSANGLGLHDMSGNVWEWCQDWYDSGYYAVSPSTDPTGASSGGARVIRGGSWGNSAVYCRSAIRGDYYPEDRIGYVGFRVARRP